MIADDDEPLPIGPVSPVPPRINPEEIRRVVLDCVVAAVASIPSDCDPRRLHEWAFAVASNLRACVLQACVRKAMDGGAGRLKAMADLGLLIDKSPRQVYRLLETYDLFTLKPPPKPPLKSPPDDG